MKRQQSTTRSDDITITKMRRAPSAVKLHLGELIIDDVEDDPLFSDLYVRHLEGEIIAAYTRLSLSKMVSGFYKNDEQGHSRVVRENLDPKVVTLEVAHILTGMRPVLYVYKSPLSPSGEFVCPDDQTPYEAYRILGISKVPVAMLDYQPNDLEESALCISVFSIPGDREHYLHKLEPARFDQVESFCGFPPRFSFSDTMDILEANANDTLDRLREFHPATKAKLHYHHTLASVLHRLLQSLRAMRLLVDHRLYDQAAIQLRAMYELALTFYVDWLAPEKIGPYLQLLAMESKQDWTAQRRQYYDEKKSEGWSDKAIKTQRESDNRLYELLTKVSEKAKINPLHGRHSELYGFLSRFAHQDFTLAAKHAYILESDFAPEQEHSLVESIAIYADLITAQIVTRIEADIGDIDIVRQNIKALS